MTTKSKNNLPSPSSFEHLPDLVSRANFNSDTSILPSTTFRQHDPRTSIDVIRQMTCSSPLRQEYANLTVLDVYDEAALIGKDFERIIEAYGTETIRDLVPKVIRILELLELQAAKNEKETDQLMEMKTRIERLEIEKSETREIREKFDQELEVIEEQWRKEADNLMALVSKLEDENRRLRDELQHKSDLDEKVERSSSKDSISVTREELQCIKSLTDENMKLKKMVKTKDKELTQKTLDIEAIQGQLERVCKLNCTLRQRNTFSVNQTQRLIVEKLDLEVQLKEKENFITHMKDRVTDDLTSPVSPTNPTNDFSTHDANQPRFSLQELRQVLWERNDLKTKLVEVEEELRLFKEHEENNNNNNDDDDNCAVQGPIPLEPDEKLYGQKQDESKIRQFMKLCLLFPMIACFAILCFCLRAFFPSTKSSPISGQNLSGQLSTPLTTANSSRFSSPAIQSTGSSSKRFSIDSLFNSNRKASKSNFPILSPPSTQ
ncbi:unnamed protein product [Adineta ricciae]|uniref:Uncharacterized protein n=2 Tax=Adineta ricciae TaxID=249248 RepID=A0A813X1H8_ADIRI|nr:unnamed protein product [Adineta ricciae]